METSLTPSSSSSSLPYIDQFHSTSTSPSCLMGLPIDLKFKILESLSSIDLGKVGCVCTELKFLSSNNDLWKHKFAEEFGFFQDREQAAVISWKNKFIASWVHRKLVKNWPRSVKWGTLFGKAEEKSESEYAMRAFLCQLSRENMPSVSRKELAEKLIDAGEKLSSPPSSIDELLELLDSLEYMLGKVEQVPPKSMLEALLPSMRALIGNELLRHKDTAVRVLVTACNNQIMRITAPNAPYEDEEMKDIFQMTLETYEKLSHMSSRCL